MNKKPVLVIRRIVSIITAFLMVSGSVIRPVSIYAAEDIVTEGSSVLPEGVIDDETEIDSPDPLAEFITGVTDPNRQDDELFSWGEDHAGVYNSLDMGYLPDSGSINQGGSSLCWAFSTAMLAEISLIRKGLVDKNTVRYSPDQLGYFFYNRINDPLGNTGGDKNVIGTGFNYYGVGGNNSFNTWNLASWISMRDEPDVPFTGTMYEDLPDDKAYHSTAHLQNAYWTSTYSEDPQNIEYIENVKELVYNNGGASVVISSSLSINENHAVYNSAGGGGHNVTVIGWDDSFSKENFAVTPPGDGAWYVRDSYDGVGNRDANGCFWMSYYSRDLTDGTADKAIAYDFEPGDNYDNNYQYDGADGNHYIRSGKDDIRVSNVFRAKGDEYLEAVAFAPGSTSMSYEINIYKLDENFTSPVGDVSLAKVTGETRYVGYRTVKLDEPVALSENDLFSVVVDVKDTSGNGDARFYVDDSYQNSNWVTFESSVAAKQSFYYDKDLEEYGYCARIKAFTDNAGSDPEQPPKKTAALATFTDEDHTYDGTLQYPTVSVNKGEDGSGEPLTEGEDYTVACYNNKNAGEATVLLFSDKYRIKNDSYTFNIQPKNFDRVSVVGIDPVYEYTGSDITPEPDITDPDLGGKKLVKGIDYTVEYSNNREEGYGRAVIKGIDNYTGEVEKTFLILKPLPLKIAAIPDQTYIPGGDEVRPDIKVKYENVVMNNGSDYIVTYSDNVNAGTASVKVAGAEKTIYYGSPASATFTIKPFNIKSAMIAGISDQHYAPGKTCTVSPTITVKNTITQEAVILSEGVDYKLSYENNTSVKSGQKVTVYIDGINNYTGRIKKTFTLRSYIPMGDTENIEISLAQYEYEYDGTAKKPDVTVIYKPDNKTLVEGTDYKVSYASNKNAGTASVTVRPTNKLTSTYNVKGTAKLFYKIKGKNPKDLTFAAISDKTYTGKPIKPGVTVYENGKKLSSAYYYVEYLDNVNAGTGRFTVYGRKNYSGELGSGTFTIKKQQFGKVKTTYNKTTGKLTVRYGNAVLAENIDFTNDTSTRLITSLETNFEVGTKKY